jgi:hypothetical protein
MEKKPATLVVNTRISDVTLAELHHFWANQGEAIRSISELVRTSCEGLSVILKQNNLLGDCPSFDHASARQYLENQGLGTKGMQTKNKFKHLQAIQVDQRTSLTFDRTEQPQSYEGYAEALAELEQCLSNNPSKPAEPDEADLRDQLLSNLPGPNDGGGE